MISAIIMRTCLLIFMFISNTTTFSEKKLRKFGSKSLAYGGILNDVEKVTPNDSLITSAAEFASAWLAARHPAMLTSEQDAPQDGRHKPYTISSPRILKLVYTDDGLTPYMYEAPHPTLHFYLQPLVWGYTFSFKFCAWHHSPYVHTFVITTHMERMHVTQHTFHAPDTPGGKITQQSHETLPLEEPSIERRSALPLVANDVITPSLYISQPAGQLLDSAVDYDKYHPSKIYDEFFLNNKFDFENNNQNFFMIRNIQCDSLKYDSCTFQNGFMSYLYEMILTHTKIETKMDWSNKGDGKSDTIENNRYNSDMCSDRGYVNLTILCYNIWNTNSVVEGSSQYSKRLSRMTRLMGSASPDIIGLQEVRFQEECCDHLGPSQMEQLAHSLPGYQFVYRPGQIQTSELPRRVEEGVAFFSRHHITKVRHVLLKRRESDAADTHQRVLLHAETDMPCFGRVHMLTTHLSLSHLARAVSVVEIWRYMQRLEGPAFLMGDFNAETHNEEVRFLAGLESLSGESTRGLRDVWSLMYPQHPGFTFSTLDKNLTKRIDFIFMREDPRVSVSDVYLMDDKGRGRKAASDHLGLVGKFLLKIQDKANSL